MPSTPQNLSPKDGCALSAPPRNGTEHKEEDDGWSGEDVDEDDVGVDGSRKRKRPMSVSCELCKQRKARNINIMDGIRHQQLSRAWDVGSGARARARAR